jgi:hypothetical protein
MSLLREEHRWESIALAVLSLISSLLPVYMAIVGKIIIKLVIGIQSAGGAEKMS